MSNNKIFTNTYITGSGRQNYLRIDNLEDPLFAGFTFDIDFTSSPLFYTINNSDYGYPNDEGLAERIETALAEMHAQNMESQQGDQGYDILPMLSANFMDRKKMGFGLQQNVYTDLPLYGATEYIYMVDKRNGDGSQNDVRYDSNGGYSNATNSYKLGDSVKEIVSESDREWANRQAEQVLEEYNACAEILQNQQNNDDHTTNFNNMNSYGEACNALNKAEVNGVTYDEAGLLEQINTINKFTNAFEQFKRTIVSWVNSQLSAMQSRLTSAYTSNQCVTKILSYDDINKSEVKDELENRFGDDFVTTYIRDDDDLDGDTYLMKSIKIRNEYEVYGREMPDPVAQKLYASDSEDCNSLLVETVSDDRFSTVRTSRLINNYKEQLVYFGFFESEDDIPTTITLDSIPGKDNQGKDKPAKVKIKCLKELPEWSTKLSDYICKFCTQSATAGIIQHSILYPLQYECDYNLSFENFDSQKTQETQQKLDEFEMALDNLRTALYGYENGEPCTSANPAPMSPYADYMEAKNIYENDAVSQAQKTQSMLRSGLVDSTVLPSEDGETQSGGNTNEPVGTDSQPSNTDSGSPTLVAPQTVLDMLGFVSGMKKMITEYPYIMQGISGLDKAYNTNYMVKDPYMGSGDDKITITCFESLDLRVSSMFNRYFNAVYDRQYRRERVPINLRRFNCSIYVHDIRNFVSQSRSEYANRMLELTDMYYSAVEFRFYDCEIVPEETGNIFNDLSNEAPSEMKKTNFAFKYGNCVVNFVPQSEVTAY